MGPAYRHGHCLVIVCYNGHRPVESYRRTPHSDSRLAGKIRRRDAVVSCVLHLIHPFYSEVQRHGSLYVVLTQPRGESDRRKNRPYRYG